MKRLWIFLGKAAFWLTWPLLYVYLYFTARTRILVAAGDEVLLLKGWFSSGNWSLPGGGLYRGENPKTGAQRELVEETGINVPADELQLLFARPIRDEHGHRFFVHAYLLQLPTQPKVTRQRLEITDSRWVSWQDVTSDPETPHLTRELIDNWRRRS